MLGLPLLRAVYLLTCITPGEHVFVVAIPSGLVRSLPIVLVPFVLYAIGFLLDRRMGWSHFGRFGFAVQAAYGLLFVGSSLYIYHLARTLNHTA